MAWTEKRIRVERGLYRAGPIYWACATPRDSRTARWHKLGPVGIQEARRLRDEFAYKLKAGQIPTPNRRHTVLDASELWFAHLDELVRCGELRPRTVASYAGGVRLHLLPDYGSRLIASITPDDLVAWHERQRRTGAATWSISARWMGVRGLFGFAARIGLAPNNPCDLLIRRERPKPGRPRTRFLTADEIQRLITHAHGVGEFAIPTLIFSGLRASELLGLVWDDIAFDERVIRVRYQLNRRGERVALKTNAGRRDVILMDELAHQLRKQRLATPFSDPSHLLISNGVGRTLGYTRLRRAFADAATAADIRDVSPHTCRHTFASLLIDQGATVEFVSNQLGHSSTRTTADIYVHLFRAREHAEAARRGMDAAFGPMLRAIDQSSRGHS